MANRSYAVKLGLDIREIGPKAKTAAGQLKQVGARGLDWVGRNEQGINQLSGGLARFGTAAVLASGVAIKKFADFDQSMSNVAATGEDARGSIDQLRQAALDAGAETAFSATEAAGAIEELAKAGVSASDILNGGLDGALDLAAAGGLEVGEAAEIAASAMTQFGLKGQDVTHIADLLAAGAGKAQGDVHDLGMALSQVGLVANQAGLTIEETTGGLAAFASAGLLGSDAGTSFKTMLQRLVAPSGEAQTKMDELGISAFDAQGEFVGLAAFAGDLQGALKDLTPEQRNAALATIFGSDAIRAASVIYNEGEAGIREWIAAVDDQGYAAEVAALRMDNLKGDIEAFLGSLETAFIGMGEGANGPLRELVQGATDVVNAFNDLPGPVKSALLAIVGGGGLVALGVAGVGKLLIGINNTREAIQSLGLSGTDSAGKLGKLRLALGALAAGGAAVLLFQQLDSAIQNLGRSTDAYVIGAGSADKALADFANGGTGRIKALVGQVDNINGVNQSFGRMVGILDTLGDTEEDFKLVSDGLARMVQAGDEVSAKKIFENIREQLINAGASAEDVDRAFASYRDAVEGASVAQDDAAGTAETMGGAVEDATPPIEDATTALEDYLTALRSATDPVFALNDALSNVGEAQTAYNDAVDEFGAGSSEAQQAGFDLADAVSTLEAAAIDGDLSFDAFESKLSSWVDQGLISGEVADDIRTRVEGLRGAAEDYSGNYRSKIEETGTEAVEQRVRRVRGKLDEYSQVNARARVGARDQATGVISNATKHMKLWSKRRNNATVGVNDRASDGLSHIFRLISSIKSKSVTITANYKQTGVIPKASGGQIFNGQPLLVGEQGPELITAKADGWVHTAPETERIYSSMPSRMVPSGSASPSTVPGVSPEDIRAALDGMTFRADGRGFLELVTSDLRQFGRKVDEANRTNERYGR